jgi:hypothetical protein
MQQTRCGLRLLLHGAKRDRERCLERLGGGGGDRLRRRLRERPAHQLDRLARDIAEAGSQARMLERRRRRPQCVEVLFRHPDHCRHLSNTFSIALIRNGPAPIKVSRRCRCSDQPAERQSPMRFGWRLDTPERIFATLVAILNRELTR